MTFNQQHDQVTNPTPSPLLSQLLHEWVELNHSPSSQRLIRRWARTEPALQHIARPADIIDITTTNDPRANDILTALVRLFQHGHQLAGQILLHAMLPKLSRIARQFGNHHGGFEDTIHLAIAEFWDRAATLPLESRSQIAASLGWDTHKRLRPKPIVEFASLEVERAHIDTDEDQILTDIAGSGPDTDTDLDTLLAWAITTKVLTADAAQLLRDHTKRRPGDPASPAVRKRCQRARDKLRDAVRAHLAAA